ncbi:MAG TPA: hypothetical protein VMF61_04530 [Candidatus Acidoferrales bacterium]|nr:hypothetical protein [Candidatus Acidoferrales bacterium]
MVRSLAKRVVVALALAGMVAAAALPLASRAQDQGTGEITHYWTAITTVYNSPYPIAGHLDLQIYPDGVLRGYYHNAHQKAFIPVYGGRDGSYIWFDIGPVLVPLGFGVGPGPNSKLHFVGTMGSDGSFRGQVWPMYNGIGNAPDGYGQTQVAGDRGNFSNPVPMTNPTQNDQYLFSAKPMGASDEDYPFTLPSPTPAP